MMTIQVYLYKNDSQLDVKDLTERIAYFQKEFPHVPNIVNLDNGDYLYKKYKGKFPIVDIGPYRLVSPINEGEMRFAFSETSEKLKIAEKKHDQEFLSRFSEKPVLTGSDKRSYWWSKHYMLVFNLIVLFYVGLPFLAPIFMKLDQTKLATSIYQIYKPLCHQLAFRSWFLFGEQAYYPRELASIENVKSYGEVSGNDEFDTRAAQDFRGNEIVGYKVALCQRDIAIYVAILVFGIIFSLLGKNLKPIPWYLWILLGLVPIGLDGFSQLLSQTGLAIFQWLPARESSPFFRTVTGGMFGLFTAWFSYPYLRDSFMDSKDQLETKLAIVKSFNKSNRDSA